eukprot:3157322-Pyramimonas_sp.AAC.1
MKRDEEGAPPNASYSEGLLIIHKVQSYFAPPIGTSGMGSDLDKIHVHMTGRGGFLAQIAKGPP